VAPAMTVKHAQADLDGTKLTPEPPMRHALSVRPTRNVGVHLFADTIGSKRFHGPVDPLVHVTPTPNTPPGNDDAKPAATAPLRQGADGELILIAVTPAVGSLARVALAIREGPRTADKAPNSAITEPNGRPSQPSRPSGVYDRLRRTEANACSLDQRPPNKGELWKKDGSQ